jgi:hypothetical protein
MKKKLRDYQQQNAIECAYILKENNIVYMQHSVRTGKTATALQTVFLNGFKNVLFLTKKKAISSIYSDYNDFQFDEYFYLTVTNYESLHKINDTFDCVILDENHVNSAFPKPSQRTKEIKARYSHLPMIMLSGTPATESASQWFHQFWMSKFSPFRQYVNFYKWSKDFVNVKDKHLGYAVVKDYTDANIEKINQSIQHLVHKFTQEQAGFETKVQENILYCEMLPITHTLINRLKKDLFIQGKDFTVLADTAVKLQNKLHQMYSGTVKFECGNSMVIDYSKAFFIRDYFKEFNTTDKHIALQQYAGAEGLSLAKADVLVFLNFGFSGSKFIQSLDRLTTMQRKENNVFFVFGKGGIESKVYKAVSNKKNYTVKMFEKDYDIPRETN